MVVVNGNKERRLGNINVESSINDFVISVTAGLS